MLKASRKTAKICLPMMYHTKSSMDSCQISLLGRSTAVIAKAEMKLST